MPSLNLQTLTYPAGGRYTLLSCRHLTLGSYNHVKGGFVPYGGRKLLASEKDAQQAVLRSYRTRLMKDLALVDDLLAQLGTAPAA